MLPVFAAAQIFSAVSLYSETEIANNKVVNSSQTQPTISCYRRFLYS
jgi:hypothetical protein